jgi:hypothetical protein
MMVGRLLAASLLASVVCSPAATLTVTSTADNGPGSLRQAIQDAADGDTIIFSLPQNSVITLTSGELLINKSLIILGPRLTPVTVQRSTAPGTPAFRIFNIGSGNIGGVSINGLRIMNGSDDQGGGGVSNNLGRLILGDCVVSGNTSDSSGGGILNSNGTLYVSHSSISSNLGTGIFNGNGSLFITGSTIADNSDGGIHNNFGDVLLDSDTISGNSTNGDGGGIYTAGGTFNINSSTISGNATADNGKGGAIISIGTSPPTAMHVTNCTITGNLAGSGGGILDKETIRVTNSIVAGNIAMIGGPDVSGGILSGGFNLIGNYGDGNITPELGDLIGTPDSPIDPLLQELADNGGLTKTHALLPGSPAINAGNDDGAPAQDQRNYVRQGVSDIGAFEFGGTISMTLQNISTRGLVQTGNNLVIGGLIISGGGPKAIILRALGPTMGRPPFNVPNVLANPVLELHDSTGATIASNDNWASAPNAQAITDSGFAPPDNLESAILTTLDPGNYTAIVRGANNTTGIALFESYDLDLTAASKFGNISTRGFVQTNDKIMIAGLIIRGPSPVDTVVIRGLGPTLGQPPFNVPNALADPFLDVRDANGMRVQSNDNWKSTQELDIRATGLAPPNDLESAIYTFLPPGSYTALLSGVNNATGNALVEVYGLN